MEFECSSEEWSDIFPSVPLSSDTHEYEEEPLLPALDSEGRWRYGIPANGDFLFGVRITGESIVSASITIGGNFTYTVNAIDNLIVIIFSEPVPMLRLRTVAVNLAINATRVKCVTTIFGNVHEDERQHVAKCIKEMPRLVYRYKGSTAVL